MPKPCPVEEFHTHGMRVLESLSREYGDERYDGLENIKIALCGPYGRILGGHKEPPPPSD